MSEPSTPFYVTGGTLRADAPSYIERDADRDLLEGLTGGEYCFVLNTRQMGKSSLMVRTATRLREAGVTVAVLDLTAVGQNLTPDQWYEGLLVSLGQQLRMEDELDDFWVEHDRLGPLQRWMEAIHQVVLPRLEDGGKLVLFIDEIDAVRSLPFPADEFFAAIRECYNRRTRDPQFEGLCFCLVGVATPSDLISEARMSPFNVGRRIRLSDFTLEEAGKLAAGMAGGIAVLKRVLYWTAGQPYMTQRLCRTVAENPKVIHPQDVDRLCHELFLSQQARESDDHLAFVRNRLLRSGVDLASLLDMYTKVRARGPFAPKVKDDETNELCATLRLAGIARAENGNLCLRNRIYDQVFDRKWVQENMPGAELRRQKEAFRRGIMRASMVGAIAVAVLAGLTGTALTQKALAEDATNSAKLQEQRANGQRDKAQRLATSLTTALNEKDSAFKQLAKALGAERTQRLLALGARKKADENARLAQAQKDVAETQTTLAQSETERGRRLLYAAGLNLAQQAIDSGNGERAKEILADQAPKPSQPDLRSFDWRFLAARERDGALIELPGHRESISAIAATRAGDRLVTGSQDGTVRIWSLGGKPRQQRVLRGHKDQVLAADINPQGTLIASADKLGSIKVWDGRTGAESFSLSHGGKDPISVVKFSPDGRRLATGGADATVRLWDMKTHKELAQFAHQAGSVNSLAFVPDGKTLLLGTAQKGAMLWSPTGELPNSRLAAGAAQATHLRGVVLKNGTLHGRYSGLDPHIVFPALNIDAATTRTIRLRLRSTGRGEGQLYWQTATNKSFGETHQVGFPVTHDGRFHDIDIPVATAKNWTGERVTALRLDPARSPALGTEFELAAITALTSKGKVTIPVGQTVAALSGAGASNVEVSPDGQQLAWVGSTGKIHLWNVRDNKEEASALASRYGVSQLLFRTSDSTLIMVGGRAERGSGGTKLQGSLSEWDLTSHRLRRTLEMNGIPNSAVMLPDGQTVAVGLSDGQLALRRLDAPGSPLQDVSYLADGYAAAWSPDGKTAASGGADGVLRLWDTASWKTVSGIRFPETLVKVRFSPDSGLLAVGEASGRVTLWQVAGTERTAPRRRFELLGHSGITGMAFSKDGTRLATCASANVHYVGDPGDNLHRPISDASLRLWDVRTGKPLYEGFSAAGSVAFTPDGKHLAAGQESGQVNFANPETGALMFAVPGNISAVTALAVSPDGRTYATGAFDGDVRLFDYDRKAAVAQLQGFSSARGRCPDIAFSPDGKRLAAASYQGLVKIYDPTTRQVLRDLNHGNSVHALAFSPDSKSLLTNGRDQTLRVWNVETGAEIRKLSLVTKAVALAPGGDRIARADADGVVRLWAPGEGAVTTLPGLSAPSARQSSRLAALEHRLEGSSGNARTRDGHNVPARAADRSRPLAHYPLNEGAGDVIRDAATKQNATARGPITWGSDASGKFLTLDGAGCVDLGDSFNFDRTSRFSYGGWVRPSDGRAAAVLSRMAGNDRFTGWDLFLVEGRAIVHVIADYKVGDALRILSRDVVAPAGEWHHLFVTYDGSGKASGLSLYVDGVLAPTTISHDTLQGSPRNAGSALIGSRSPHPGDTNTHQALKGDLQSLRIYDRTLTAREVSLLAHASGVREPPRLDGVLAHYALDKLAGSKSPPAIGGWGEATATGSLAPVPGRFGQALQFNGASRLTLPKATDFDIKTAFSAGAWVKTADTTRGTVLSTQTGEGTPGWELWLASGGVRFELVRKWPEDWAFSSTADGILPAGEWRHVFVTYDGSGKSAGVKFFVDGKPVANTQDVGEVKGSIRSSQAVNVGSRNGLMSFKGAIDEVTIFSRTLSAAEVALLANTSSKDLIIAQSRNRRPGYLAALKERNELTADIAGQSTELTLVRYSPDGRRLLIAGKRGDAQIVSALDGKPLVGLPTAATMADFSLDGRRVVTSDEKRAQVWDAAKGALLGTIPAGKGAVQAVAFQADGRAAAAALVERGNTTIVFWDLAAKRISRRMSLPGAEVTSLEFEPAGKYMAAGALAGQIRLWSLPGMKEQSPLRGHRSAVLTLAFAPDGVTLASGSRDATVRFWNLLAGREVAALRGQHEQAVTYARFSRDGLSLLTSSADAPVRVWRAPNPKALDLRAARFASALDAPEMPGPRRVTGISQGGEITLTWQPVHGATDYEVRRATTAGGPFLPVGRTRKPAYRDRAVAPGVKYFYSIAGVGDLPGLGSQPVSVLCSGQPQPPAGLSAQAYGNTVTLTWDEVPGAGGYVVSRAEKQDGPYVALAKDLATGYFEDKKVPSGEFYYRVAASVGTEVGAASAALSVRPPWSMADIGSGKAGSAGFTGEQIKAGSFGSRIGGTVDQFRFVYQPAAGDVEILAAVDRGTGGAAKAGLMIRASDLPGSTYVYVGLDGGAQSMTARAAFGQASTSFAKTSFPGEAKWLKLVRRGDRCTALASADGKAWLVVGWTPAALSPESLIGLAVSGATNAQVTATFDNVRIGPPSEGDRSASAASFKAPPGPNLGALQPSHVYTNAEPQSVASIDEGALRFTRDAPTKQAHETGIVRSVPLVEGTAYTLQFRARADRSRIPWVGVQTAGGNYAESGLRTEFPVDTEWRTYRFTFTAVVKEPALGTSLYFHFGEAPGSIWLADVALVPQLAGPAGTSTSVTDSEPRLAALPAAMEPVLRSGNPSSPAVIRFVNSANRPVELFWLNYQGGRQSYGVLAPGASREQVTATNHPWLITRQGSSAIAIFVSQTALGVAEITQAMLSADLYPKRSASVGKAQLDLTQTYNARLDEPWHGTEGPSLAALAPGVTVVNGITFDVRGIVSTTGAELEKARPGALPVSVKAVPVGMPVQALHFLHSTGWMAPAGTEIGRYVIHYADGSTATKPIVYGQDVQDWATGDDASPAPALRAGNSRLYVSTWRNPKPGVPVVSFDFVSTMTTCAPFLVAVTAELSKLP